MVGKDVGKASDIFSSLLAFFYLYFVLIGECKFLVFIW